MIYRFKILSLLILILSVLSIPVSETSAANMIYGDSDYNLRIFYTEDERIGWDAVLKGKVLSLGARIDSGGDELSEQIHDKTKVTVRLYNRNGIKVGDTLFVVSDRNLIVSRIKVQSIFKSATFGFLLVGYGNFLIANEGDRVVQRSDDELSKYAYIYKARGDYYQEIGQTGKAISVYKKAIETDRGNPGAHLALGYSYLKSNMLQFAFNEFSEAKKRITRLYDNEDKFLLHKGMAEVRFKEAYYERLPSGLRKKYISEGIEYSKDALQIYPDSKEVNFFLGMFYYKNPEPDDVKAKKQFLKIIDIDPENINAYIALSELYYKHRNKEKARYYADKALRIDPANERARFIYNLSD